MATTVGIVTSDGIYIYLQTRVHRCLRSFGQPYNVSLLKNRVRGLWIAYVVALMVKELAPNLWPLAGPSYYFSVA